VKKEHKGYREAERNSGSFNSSSDHNIEKFLKIQNKMRSKLMSAIPPINQSLVDNLNKFNRDQIKRHIEEIDRNIEGTLKLQNEIWHGILKLIITLSSSMLGLSIAFVEKVIQHMSGYIIFSWLFFLASIILGIIALTNEVIFFNNQVYKESQKRKAIIELSKEKKSKNYGTEKYPELVTYNNIIWGVVTLQSFFIAMTLMANALIKTTHYSKFNIWVLITSIGFLIAITIVFYFKRKVVREKKLKWWGKRKTIR
jgi:hypothetical protein